MLQPGEALTEDALFWQQQRDGLVLFLPETAETSPSRGQIHRLPVAFDPLAVTARRYHVKPLMPLLSRDGTFYLLSLHEDRISLHEGARHSLDRLSLRDVPNDPTELPLSQDDTQVSARQPARLAGVGVQFHTGTPPAPIRGSERSAAFHGHGAVENQEERERSAFDDILSLYQDLDAALQSIIHDKQAPLILAGVPSSLSIYRQANSYPYVLEDAAVARDPASLSKEELHASAWEPVAPRFERDRRDDEQTYRRLSGQRSPLVSSELEVATSRGRCAGSAPCTGRHRLRRKRRTPVGRLQRGDG